MNMQEEKYMTKSYKQVLLLCGISGSGKTTFARSMASSGYRHLSIDDIMWRTHGLCGIDYPEDRYDEYRDIAEKSLLEELSRLIASGHKVIIDSPLCKRAKRDFYRRYVSSLGAEYSLIFFDTPLGLLKKRLRKRNLTPGPDAAIVTDDMVELFYKGFERPHDDEPYISIAPQQP